MEKKRILLIAGAGTLGGYASRELLKLGWQVDVIALEDYRSCTSALTYYRERVSDDLLKRLFAEHHYDAIVDFIHYSNPETYPVRGKLLLENTDQLIFLSSYRTYADREHPVRETSPKLLDTADDEDFLLHEDYALPKSKNENFLRASGYNNWTIIRPIISFSHYRLDLVTLGGSQLLLRAKEGKKIVLPITAKKLTAGLNWAGNVGKQIAHLAGNPKALGEAFTLGSGEVHTWEEITEYYHELMGLDFVWADDADYYQIVGYNPYGLYYDRLYDRRVDVSKVMSVTGLTEADMVGVREGLIIELSYLSEHPEDAAKYDTSFGRAINERMDAYLASHGLA